MRSHFWLLTGDIRRHAWFKDFRWIELSVQDLHPPAEIQRVLKCTGDREEAGSAQAKRARQQRTQTWMRREPSAPETTVFAPTLSIASTGERGDSATTAEADTDMVEVKLEE